MNGRRNKKFYLLDLGAKFGKISRVLIQRVAVCMKELCVLKRGDLPAELAGQIRQHVDDIQEELGGVALFAGGVLRDFGAIWN